MEKKSIIKMIALCFIACLILSSCKTNGNSPLPNNQIVQPADPTPTSAPPEGSTQKPEAGISTEPAQQSADPSPTFAPPEGNTPKPEVEITSDVKKPTTGSMPGNRMSNLMGAGIFASDDKWNYAVLKSAAWQDGSLYKISTDGAEYIQLTDHLVTHINLVEDWIYYSLFDEGIFRLKKDSSLKEQIYHGPVFSMLIVGETIYFVNNSADFKIYSMDTNGQNVKKVADNRSYELQYENGYLYFNSYDPTMNIYRLNVSNSQEVEKLAENVEKYTIYENCIYFFKFDERQLYKKKIGASEPIVILENIDTEFYIENNRIYFTKYEDEYSIYTSDLDGNNVSEYFRADRLSLVREIHGVVRDTVYYWMARDIHGSGDDQLARVKDDGTFTDVRDLIDN